MKRAGDAPLPSHAKSSEIRRHPSFSFEPLQPGTQRLQPIFFKANRATALAEWRGLCSA